jgi:hypothetical protein
MRTAACMISQPDLCADCVRKMCRIRLFKSQYRSHFSVGFRAPGVKHEYSRLNGVVNNLDGSRPHLVTVSVLLLVELPCFSSFVAAGVVMPSMSTSMGRKLARKSTCTTPRFAETNTREPSSLFSASSYLLQYPTLPFSSWAC